jgi:hypothetical protein
MTSDMLPVCYSGVAATLIVLVFNPLLSCVRAFAGDGRGTGEGAGHVAPPLQMPAGGQS